MKNATKTNTILKDLIDLKNGIISFLGSTIRYIIYMQYHIRHLSNQKKSKLSSNPLHFFSINPNYPSGYLKKWFDFFSRIRIKNPNFFALIWRIEARFNLGIVKNKTLSKKFLTLIEDFFFLWIVNLYWLSEGRRERKSVVCVCVWFEKNNKLDKKIKENGKKEKSKSETIKSLFMSEKIKLTV